MEVLILGTNADLRSKGFTNSMKIILSEVALRKCSQEKVVLKIYSKIYRRTPFPKWSVISIKLLCNVIEIALWHGCSPANLLHIFRLPFPKNTSDTSGRLLPYYEPLNNYSCGRYVALKLRWRFFQSNIGKIDKTRNFDLPSMTVLWWKSWKSYILSLESLDSRVLRNVNHPFSVSRNLDKHRWTNKMKKTAIT